VIGPAAAAMVIGCFAIVAPTNLTAARQRLVSVGHYGQDKSLRARTLEARHVTEQIRAHPALGSGLGAQILWGRPYERVKPTYQSFSHNGYLWLAWKLGIPSAALLVLLLAMAIARRRGPPAASTPQAVRLGAQAALLASLLQGFIYPTFVASVTVAMGLLLAMALGPWAANTGNRRTW
jgi:O-antigen ligase